MLELLPLFVNLSGRRVLLVGGGSVAASKLETLRTVGADVVVVAPNVDARIVSAGVRIEQRPFQPGDLDGVWLVVAAAPPDVNREVAVAAGKQQVFVNAVDDPAHATAYLGGVVRRDGVTVAISTTGAAPGIAGLLREALDVLLPRDMARWMTENERMRRIWRRESTPMSERRPLLLEALNGLYRVRSTKGPRQGQGARA